MSPPGPPYSPPPAYAQPSHSILKSSAPMVRTRTRLPPLPSFDAHFLNTYQLLSHAAENKAGTIFRVCRRGWTDTPFALKLVARAKLSPSEMGILPPDWPERKVGLSKLREGYEVTREVEVLWRLGGIGGVCELVDCWADRAQFYILTTWHKPDPRHASSSPAASNNLNGRTPHALALRTITPSRPGLLPSAPITTNKRSRGGFKLAEISNVLGMASLPPPCLSAFCAVGETSREREEEHKVGMEEDEARIVFEQVVQTLAEAARRGVVHGDVERRNIIIDKRLNVKLIDLSAATMFNPHALPPLQPPPYRGNLTHAPPEVLHSPSAPYAPLPAEIYSLGLLLHALLAGPDAPRSLPPAGNWSAPASDLLTGCLAPLSQRWTLDQVRASEWLRGMERSTLLDGGATVSRRRGAALVASGLLGKVRVVGRWNKYDGLQFA